MSASRTSLVAVLGLLVGFGLAQIKSCVSKPTVTSIEIPKPIKAGDVLTWEPPDPQFGHLQLGIPKDLCVKYPDNFKLKNDGNWWGYVDQEVKCTVQKGIASDSYFYTYNLQPGSHAQPNLNDSAAQAYDVVGSCSDCDRGDGSSEKASANPIPAYVTCSGSDNDTHLTLVTDHPNYPDIRVYPNNDSVIWKPQGDLKQLKATTNESSPLCSFSQYLDRGVECVVDKTRRDGQPHPYTLSSANCGDSVGLTLTPDRVAPSQ